MSEQTETAVSFQITIPKKVRNRFKGAAAIADLQMHELGQIILDWTAHVVSDDEIPPSLQLAIDRFKKEKAKAKK